MKGIIIVFLLLIGFNIIGYAQCNFLKYDTLTNGKIEPRPNYENFFQSRFFSRNELLLNEKIETLENLWDNAAFEDMANIPAGTTQNRFADRAKSMEVEIEQLKSVIEKETKIYFFGQISFLPDVEVGYIILFVFVNDITTGNTKIGGFRVGNNLNVHLENSNVVIGTINNQGSISRNINNNDNSISYFLFYKIERPAVKDLLISPIAYIELEALTETYKLETVNPYFFINNYNCINKYYK